jgi:hypothetical protein
MRKVDFLGSTQHIFLRSRVRGFFEASCTKKLAINKLAVEISSIRSSILLACTTYTLGRSLRRDGRMDMQHFHLIVSALEQTLIVHTAEIGIISTFPPSNAR